MALFALIHGGGSSSWDWHLVAPQLEEAGHRAVAVDLPIEDADATLQDYVDVVAAAVDDAGAPADALVIVGHSMGGYPAALAAEQLQPAGLVYLSGMIPKSGESFGDWWEATGHTELGLDGDDDWYFFSGVSEELADQARATGRPQRGAWLALPWPGTGHSGTPTRVLACSGDDFLPPWFMRSIARDRLGLEPVVIAGGHYAAISHPRAVATALHEFAESL